jgi:hypothetical protein
MLTNFQAVKILRSTIKKSEINQVITIEQLDSNFQEYLFSLPKYERHQGCNFIVEIVSGYGGKQFKTLCLITQVSGYHLPITVGKLKQPNLLSPKSNKRQTVLAAMRLAIENQIELFRIETKVERAKSFKNGDYSVLLCPLTKKRLTSRSHVDHIIPFIRIADNWLESSGLTSYGDIKLVRGQLSGGILKSWQDFHLVNAKLQLVSASANIKKGASGYTSRFKN